jgi:hypothetical protein
MEEAKNYNGGHFGPPSQTSQIIRLKNKKNVKSWEGKKKGKK